MFFFHTIFISFFIYPPPFPLLLYMATLTVVHQTYTEEGMLLLPMPLWVWGTDSQKHPLLHPPSLSYFIWLPWQWYIRHTQRRACYCFLCLSEYGELIHRNTLCCISWPSPVSVINHKTMKAINRSLPTLTPFPTTISLKSKLIKTIELIWEKLWGMKYCFQG